MVDKIKTFFVALVISIFGVAVPVFAQEDATTKPTDSQQTDEKTANRAERLQTLKDQKTEKLDEAKSNRIKTRCKSAQGKINSLQARISVAVSNRKKVYKEIGEKLDTLIVKLQTAGIDTANFDLVREDVRADVLILEQALDDYDITLSDLSLLDCESDPELFQAALLSAREQQAQVKTLAKDFRNFATNQLRTELQKIRSQFTDSTNTEGGSQ